jgi:hypothetical protein
MSTDARYIRIVSVPPGEAPLWVREKWVGLELPLVPGRWAPGPFRTSGVLTRPRNPFSAIWRRLTGRMPQRSGYAVDAAEAVNVLERTAPEAARWWRENAPGIIAHHRHFLFRATNCEDVPPREAARWSASREPGGSEPQGDLYLP